MPATCLAPSADRPLLGLQPVSEVGGRYFTIAPYAEDTWKVNSKLTIDAGLRWDYLPPYHEVKNRWSFLNPNITNPATGTPGALQFAGSYGGPGVSCGCRTPVPTYWNNWGPRVGITYQTDAKTVFRIGVGRVFSQGGGVGGRGGAFNGTGQLGFNTTATAPAEVTTGGAAAPSFYLNNSAILPVDRDVEYGPWLYLSCCAHARSRLADPEHRSLRQSGRSQLRERSSHHVMFHHAVHDVLR